jgi:hypothetical protein
MLSYAMKMIFILNYGKKQLSLMKYLGVGRILERVTTQEAISMVTLGGRSQLRKATQD